MKVAGMSAIFVCWFVYVYQGNLKHDDMIFVMSENTRSSGKEANQCAPLNIWLRYLLLLYT